MDAMKRWTDYHAQLVAEGLLPARGQAFEDGMLRDPYVQDRLYRHLYDAVAADQMYQVSHEGLLEAGRRYAAQKARQFAASVLAKAAIGRRAKDLRRLAVIRSESDRLTEAMRSNATPQLARAMERTDNAVRRQKLDRLRRRARMAEITRQVEIRTSRDERRGDPGWITRTTPNSWETHR